MAKVEDLIINNKPILKMVVTDSNFLESTANCIYDFQGADWYYQPFWYKKLGDGLFQQFSFEELPTELKNEIKELRK